MNNGNLVGSESVGENRPADGQSEPESDLVDAQANGIGHSFTNLAEVASKKLKWVWEGLIPRGKLSLLVGESGVGKSLFTLGVAARVSYGFGAPSVCLPMGYPWHEDSANTREVGAAVLFSSDDDLADTIRPRLVGAGAELENVYLLSAESGRRIEEENGGQAPKRTAATVPFDLKRDLPILEAKLLQLREAGVDVRLIVIDPIDDCRESSDGGGGLAARLAELAAWSNAAVLVVVNSNITEGGRGGKQGLLRGRQGLAMTARSVLMIVKDLENENQRLVLPVKQNLSGNWTGFAFAINKGVLEWIPKTTSLTADQYFALARKRMRNPLYCEEVSEIERVTNWLKKRLSSGRVASIEIRTDAGENEIGYGTLRRAFAVLNCQATKDWSVGRWYWRLPGPAQVSEDS